jgi:hypothetical protein
MICIYLLFFAFMQMLLTGSNVQRAVACHHAQARGQKTCVGE